MGVQVGSDLPGLFTVGSSHLLTDVIGDGVGSFG